MVAQCQWSDLPLEIRRESRCEPRTRSTLPMLTFGTKKLSTGAVAKGQKEAAYSFKLSAHL